MSVTVCDRCGLALADGETRFLVDIRVYAPYDTLVIDEETLAADHEARLAELALELEELDPEEATDDVARSFRFLLCRSCQRRYLRDPLEPGW